MLKDLQKKIAIRKNSSIIIGNRFEKDRTIWKPRWMKN